MTELYRNEFYHVALVEDDEMLPYHVIHNEHNVCGDNKFDNFPQALIVSEQFSQLLSGDRWKQELLRSQEIQMGAVNMMDDTSH